MDDLRQGTLSLTAAGLALGGSPPPASPSSTKRPKDGGDLRTQPHRSAYDGKDRIREDPNGNISGGEDVEEGDEEPPLELIVKGRSALGESVASEMGEMSGDEDEDGLSEELELFSSAKRARAEGANAEASGSGTRVELARAVGPGGARRIQLEMDDDWGSPVDETEVNSPSKNLQPPLPQPSTSTSTSPLPPLPAAFAAPSRPQVRSPRKKNFSVIVYVFPKKRPQRPLNPVAKPPPSPVDAAPTIAMDDSEEEPVIPASKYKRMRMSASSKARRTIVESDEDDELTIVPSKPPAKVQGKGKKAPETLVLSDSSDEDTLPPPSRAKRVAPSKRRSLAKSASDSSDDHSPPPKRRSTTSSTVNKRPTISSKRAVVFADSDSSEDLPTASQLTSAKRRTLPSTSKTSNLKRTFASSSRSSPKKSIKASLASQKKKRGERRSSDEEESESDDFIVEDDEMLGSRSTGRRERPKTRKKVVAKRGKGKGRARAIRSSDEDDLELSGKETVLTDRLRVFSPVNKSKFEQLRASRSLIAEKREKAATQKRSGVVESSDKAPTASRALPRYAGGQSSESSVDDPDDEDDSTSQEDDNLDADLEGFLVEGEEDDDTKKVVERHREEVRERAQGLKFFLKSYLQYIVHVILCPEVDWLEDEAFKTAFQAVTKERKGLLSSLIGSSAWKVNFKAAIDTYPRFDIQDLFGFDRGSPCDACSMGASRASTLSGELLGEKYDPKTFEPIKDSDLSSEDSDSDGEPRAPPPRQFNLGKHCAGRAQVYHEIQHWPHEMYETLLGHVRQSIPDVRAPVGSKEERKKERKRLLEIHSAEAERCSVLLEENTVIPNLAKAFLDMVSTAKTEFIR